MTHVFHTLEHTCIISIKSPQLSIYESNNMEDLHETVEEIPYLIEATVTGKHYNLWQL